MNRILRYTAIVASVLLLMPSCYHEDNRIFPSCDDGILNQDEEFVDCGGPNCPECPPACDNGILDWVAGWQEQGVDCGGPCEDEGLFCCENGVLDVNPFDPTISENWVDCRWDVYPPYPIGPDPALDGQPIPPNSGFPGSLNECPVCDPCSNGYHDPGEEVFVNGTFVPVIDCGGTCTPCIDLCDDGLVNGAEGPCPDCGGVCPSCNFSHCQNGVQDTFGPNDPQNEIGIDCGGCGCPTCPELCDDGILNGLEEAIDCGIESGCVPCNDPVLCGDGVQNGFEDGIDCYNGTDGLSACAPCASLCGNGLCDGVETDQDCGGPADAAGNACQPCGSDNLFLRYEVDGELYESFIGSIAPQQAQDGLTGGNAGTMTPDSYQISGGICHQMIIALLDDEYQVANNFDANYTGGPNNNWTDNLANATNPHAVVQFTDNDGTVYTGANHTVGMTISITSINLLALPPVVEGTFSGTVSDGQGLPTSTKVITNGQFKIQGP